MDDSARSGELLRLVRRVDARQQIGELLARYGTAVDDRDFAAIGEMFTADGEFHGVQGRDAIVAFYRARTASFTTSSHYALNWQIEFESDDAARGLVNAHAELCIGGRTVRLAIRYLDRYVRTADGWCFAQRVLRFRYVLPFDEVARGLDDPLRVRWPGTEPQPADLPDQLATYRDSLRAAVAPAAPPNH